MAQAEGPFLNDENWLQQPELIWFCSLTVEPEYNKGPRDR